MSRIGIYRISAPPDHPHNPEYRTPAHRHYARDPDERDLGIRRSRRCQGAPILAGVKAKPFG